MDYDDLLDYLALQMLGQFDPNLEGGKLPLHKTLNDQTTYNQEKGENCGHNEKQQLNDWDGAMRMVGAVELPSYGSLVHTHFLSHTLKILKIYSSLALPPQIPPQKQNNNIHPIIQGHSWFYRIPKSVLLPPFREKLTSLIKSQTEFLGAIYQSLAQNDVNSEKDRAIS